MRIGCPLKQNAISAIGHRCAPVSSGVVGMNGLFREGSVAFGTVVASSLEFVAFSIIGGDNTISLSGRQGGNRVYRLYEANEPSPFSVRLRADHCDGNQE